jgi:hypothetical protein
VVLKFAEKPPYGWGMVKIPNLVIIKAEMKCPTRSHDENA